MNVAHERSSYRIVRSGGSCRHLSETRNRAFPADHSFARQDAGGPSLAVPARIAMSSLARAAFLVVTMLLTLSAAFATFDIPRVQSARNRQWAQANLQTPAVPVRGFGAARVMLFR